MLLNTNRNGNKMNIENLDAVVCLYCEGIVSDRIDHTRTQYCVPCNEYKSLMTVREYLAEYQDLVFA